MFGNCLFHKKGKMIDGIIGSVSNVRDRSYKSEFNASAEYDHTRI